MSISAWNCRILIDRVRLRGARIPFDSPLKTGLRKSIADKSNSGANRSACRSTRRHGPQKAGLGTHTGDAA